MSSQRRQEANQANARLSTGPQTPEGKARSSQNARKHGLSAREVVIAPQDREEFEDFLAAHQDDLQPQGILEQDLFNQLVLAAWNLQRISRLEAGLAQDGDPLTTDSAEAAVQRLARYHTRAERTFYRSLRELRALQTNRALRNALPADPEADPEAPSLPPLASIAEWTKRTHRNPALEPSEDDSPRYELVYLKPDPTPPHPDPA
jgi:hypothetical protein